MTSGTSEELRWKTILLVDERFLVFIINEGNRYFLGRLVGV
jgi:hypothetical protein